MHTHIPTQIFIYILYYKFALAGVKQSSSNKFQSTIDEQNLHAQQVGATPQVNRNLNQSLNLLTFRALANALPLQVLISSLRLERRLSS